MSNSRRLLLGFAALALLFAAPRAQAQFTLVSGTVTDPNGLPWACGTISATLVNNNGVSATLNGQAIQGFTAPVKLGCPTDPTTSRTPGFFQMQLADNTQIKCGIATCGTQTTWSFTANTTGIAPPQGTGPQSFTQAFTISGSSQTLSFSSVPALGFSSGAASPKGTSDVGSSTINLLDPKYNFPGTSQWSCQAGITNGSNIVTVQANDRKFTGNPVRNAQVGDVVWASAAQCGGENSIIVPSILIARTTICSVDSATQVHVGTVVNGVCGTPANATASCTITAQDGCVFVWGPDAFPAVEAAWVDAGNACGAIDLPAGGIMLSAEPFNTTSLCPGPAGGNDIGSSLDVGGQGPYTTMFLMWPDPPFTHTMFQDPIGGQRRSFHDFGVASFAPAPAAANGKVGFSMNFYGEFYNISFLDYFPCNGLACSNTFIPLQASGVGNASVFVHDNVCLNSGDGSGCFSISNNVMFTHNAIQNTQRLLNIGATAGGANYTSENTMVLGGSQGAAVYGNSSSNYSTNDTFNCTAPGATSLPCVDLTGAGTVVRFKNANISTSPTTTGPALRVQASAVASIEGESSSVSFSNSNGGTGNAITNAGTLTLRNTFVAVAGGGAALNNSGTVTFKEGNGFSGGNITNTGVIQIIPGEGGYVGACTGVVTSASTVGLYGLGQTAATACTSTTVANGVVATKAGTIYALYCTATAGNQAADACTVVKNGVAQTMTCSLNAVTSCTDGTTAHWVTYVAGDILGIEVIGGTATTLANVKGLIVAM